MSIMSLKENPEFSKTMIEINASQHCFQLLLHFIDMISHFVGVFH